MKILSKLFMLYRKCAELSCKYQNFQTTNKTDDLVQSGQKNIFLNEQTQLDYSITARCDYGCFHSFKRDYMNLQMALLMTYWP